MQIKQCNWLKFVETRVLLSSRMLSLSNTFWATLEITTCTHKSLRACSDGLLILPLSLNLSPCDVFANNGSSVNICRMVGGGGGWACRV